MHFSTIYFLSLLALFGSVWGQYRVGTACIAPALTCRNLPTASASSCSSLITQSAISRPTCTECTSTSVLITSSRSTGNTTVTVPTTRTTWLTQRSGTTLIVTRTNVITQRVTQTVTVLRMTTQTTTVARTTTRTTALASQVCIPRALLARQVPNVLPPVCSCYVTSTRRTGIYTITLTSIIPAGTTTATVFTTRVVTNTYIGSTVVNTRNYSTTLRLTVPTTRTSTSTVLRTSTRTATATVHSLCVKPAVTGVPMNGSNISSATAVVVGSISECCNRCWNTPGCNSYNYTWSNRRCVVRTNAVTLSCISSYCSRGRFVFSRGTSQTLVAWGLGPCGRF